MQQERLTLFDLTLTPLTWKKYALWFDRIVQKHCGGYISVVAVHLLMECQRDPELLKGVNRSLLVVPDGMPLVWWLRSKGAATDRIYGPELLMKTAHLAQKFGVPMIVVGGSQGQSGQVKQMLLERFPQLEITAHFDTPGKKITQQQLHEIQHLSKKSGYSIVVLGLGCPFQERWMIENSAHLPHTLLLGVGAAFDFLTGRVRQAPAWIRQFGFEWLFRFFQDPRRLWHRYLILNSKFLITLFKKQIFAGFLFLGFALSVGLSAYGIELFARMYIEKETLSHQYVIDFKHFGTNLSKEYIFMLDFIQARLDSPTTFSDQTFDIAVVGDSFVFGEPYREEDIVRKKIEEQLKTLNIQQPVRVTTFGLAGSGPDQQFRMISHILEQQKKPDLIIWNFYTNDIWDGIDKALYSLQTDGKLRSVDARTNFVYLRQIAFNLIPLPFETKKNSYALHPFFNAFQLLELRQVPMNLRYNSMAWSAQKLELLIEQVQASTSQHEVPLYLTLVAPQEFYNRSAGKGSLEIEYVIEGYQRLLAVLQDEPNFYLLNADNDPQVKSKVLGLTSGGDLLSDLLFANEQEESHIHYGNRHYSRLGYEFMAQAMVQAINKDLPK